MTKILILYYSSYGHVEAMAQAAAEGVRAAGAEAVVKRVPELVPEDAARKAGIKLDQAAPVADPQELAEYDGFLFGTPTRFGNMASQMKNFLDQTGGLWFAGKLIGKPAGGVRLHRDAARRPGIDPAHLPHRAFAPRHGWWWGCPIRRRAR